MLLLQVWGTHLVRVKGGLILAFLQVEESRPRSAWKDAPWPALKPPYWASGAGARSGPLGDAGELFSIPVAGWACLWTSWLTPAGMCHLTSHRRLGALLGLTPNEIVMSVRNDDGLGQCRATTTDQCDKLRIQKLDPGIFELLWFY